MIHQANGTPDLFGWIERDQYVYYLTIAYMLADPADWPTFRRAVHGGLQAALGLAPPHRPARTPTLVHGQTRQRSSTRSRCSTTSAIATTPPSTGPAS
jgi:hypothetical protein